MHSRESDLGFALLLDVDSEVIVARVDVEVISVARHVTGVESTAQFVVLFTRGVTAKYSADVVCSEGRGGCCGTKQEC